VSEHATAIGGSVSDRRRLVLAHAINNGGETATGVALTIFLFGSTGSFLQIALLLAAKTVPQMVWSGRAGRLADGRNPRRVAVRALSLLGGLLLILASVPSQVWLILALVAAIASVYTFADSAIFTLIPNVSGPEPAVRRRVQANMSAARWVGAAAGAVVAGWLVLWLGYWAALVLDAATYGVAALLISRITARGGEASAEESDTPGGPTSRLALLRAYPRVAIAIGVLASAIVFLGTAQVLMIGFVSDVLHGDAALYGLIESVYMWGILVGTLLSRAFAHKLPPMPTLLVSCGLNGLASVLQAIIARTAATVGISIGGGITHGTDSFAMRAVLTEEADDAVIGRLFSVFYATASGAELLSYGLGGLFGELFPVRWAIGAAGACAVVVVLAAAVAVRSLASRTAATPS
jgi:MFS family permease